MNTTSNNNPVLSSSSISGTNVYNTRDKKLGDIKDIMIDTSSGTVSYLVLSVSEGLFSNKYFAVPLEAVQFNTVDENIILDVDENWLDNAPGFDKDNWPSSADSKFESEMHSYYKTKPYREQRGTTDATGTTTTGTTIV